MNSAHAFGIIPSGPARARLLVPASGELVTAIALGQAWETLGPAQGRGGAEHPIRQPLVPLG
jgi:hypothetical protein